jgi:hypothetical protein
MSIYQIMHRIITAKNRYLKTGHFERCSLGNFFFASHVVKETDVRII